ncbi:MAG: DUF1559 domain-containing protein [Planctomycetaceae bacterium]
MADGLIGDERKTRFQPQRRHFVWTGVLLLFVFLGCWGVNLLTDVPLVVSKETTFITSPLTPDGKYVDYFTALEEWRYPPGMKTDQNGYRLIVRELGVPKDCSPEVRADVYEKLGLDPLKPPTLTFQEPEPFLRQYLTTTQGTFEYEELKRLTDQVEGNWTLADLPMMEAWLSENGPALDLIAVAVRLPEFCVPLSVVNARSQMIIDVALPECFRARPFARSLIARAKYRAATGDIDGAIHDVNTIQLLGRRFGVRGLEVEALVGIAIESIAYGAGAAGSLDHPPTTAQLQQLVDNCNALPKGAELEDVLLSERYVVCDTIQSLSQRVDASGVLYVPLVDDFSNLRKLGIGLDWNIVASRMNENFDTMRLGGKPVFPPLSFTIAIRRPRSVVVGDYLACVLLPTISSIEGAFGRRDCQEQLYRISLAMLLYEREHGTLPPEYSADETGRPLHSWRVLLLPYLGEKELSMKIRLDEPWDSLHNQQFHRAAVDVYQCPLAHSQPGETTYAVISGATTAFQGATGKRLDSFGPKSGQMVLVAERNVAACWMDPTQEIPLANAQLGINQTTTPGLGSPHPGGAHFALRSAAVTFLSQNIPPETLLGLLDGTTDKIE